MNMVERVARAISKSEIQDERGWEAFLPEAIAAIDAMRETTDRMADDGYRAMHYGADTVWQAMIDAALSE